MGGKFQVIAHELHILTYEIVAESAEAAAMVWRDSYDGGRRGEPDENSEGAELARVIDPEGYEIPGDLIVIPERKY